MKSRRFRSVKPAFHKSKILSSSKYLFIKCLGKQGLRELERKDSYDVLLEEIEHCLKYPEDPFAKQNAKFEAYYKQA